MSGMFKHEKLRSLIHHEIARLFLDGSIKDPRINFIITITNTKLSKDLHYCLVNFTIIGETDQVKETEKILNHAAGYIQKLLGQRIKLRFTPKLEFRYDQSLIDGFEMMQKLSDMEKKDQEPDKDK